MGNKEVLRQSALRAAAKTQVGENASAAGILADQIVARDQIIGALQAERAALAATLSCPVEELPGRVVALLFDGRCVVDAWRRLDNLGEFVGPDQRQEMWFRVDDCVSAIASKLPDAALRAAGGVVYSPCNGCGSDRAFVDIGDWSMRGRCAECGATHVRPRAAGEGGGNGA